MKSYILLITSFLLILTGKNTSAQNQPSGTTINKIVVYGSHEMEVEPDEIYVNFTLREHINTRKEKVDIDILKKEFLNACSAAGILKESITVVGVSGSAYTNWYYRKRKQDPEFKASVTYVIKFSSAPLLDNLISKLNDDAISNMYISKRSHSKIEEFRKEVKIKATQAAKDKATYLAASIDEKIKRAILIEEINNDGYQPPMMMKMANSAGLMEADNGYGNDGSVPFESIKIRYEVKAEFELQ